MKICLTLAARTLTELRAAMLLGIQSGAHICELRLDTLDDVPSRHDVAELLAAKTGPVVVTVRRRCDGGAWDGPEAPRRALLTAASELGADWIDVEHDIAVELESAGSARRVVSVHVMDDTPPDLTALIDELTALGGDVVKFAVMPRSWHDVLAVLDAVRACSVPAIGLAMGSLGVVTRVLAGRLGAPWTYAAPDHGTIGAPGQLRLRELLKLLRYPSLSESTELYAVVGDPIAHSLSPLVHNAAFIHHKRDAVYMALRVPSPDIAGLLPRLGEFGFSGFSVTLPHKSAVLQDAQGVDRVARKAGVANTLVLRDDPDGPRWWATNTDIAAAVGAIARGLGGRSIAGQSALILGAGGVAHALADGLADTGCRVTVSARRIEQARALAERVNGNFVHWDQRGETRCTIVCNATPVGMHPNVDASPYPAAWMRPGALFFDTVYNPERTRFVLDAEARGCKVVTGVSMFVEQAALQYELFTATSAPRELMGELVRRELAVRARGTA